MEKGKIEAMVTKFSEKFSIIMLKKRRKFCRCGLTHLDAKPIFKKSFRYLWATLYVHYPFEDHFFVFMEVFSENYLRVVSNKEHLKSRL